MLSVVKEMPPARTLIEMAAGDPEQVYAMMRREFGRRALLIATTNMYVFEDDEFTEETIGTQMSGTGMVSGIFCGIETVETMERVHPEARLSLVTEVQRQLAVFATHMDYRVPEVVGDRMQMNDTSIASGYPRVAIALDEPVEFHRLKQEAVVREEERRAGYKLHLVTEIA
jgi:hypothetical protein